MTAMPKMFKVAIALAVAIILASAALVPAFIRARTTPSSNACVNNLRQLDGAKQQWALENRRTKGDPVAWEDIKPYLKMPLVCSRVCTYLHGCLGEFLRSY